MHNGTKDKGRPLGAGLPEQASNNLKQRWLSIADPRPARPIPVMGSIGLPVQQRLTGFVIVDIFQAVCDRYSWIHLMLAALLLLAV